MPGRRHSLKTQLSLAIAMTVLLTVGIISVFSNIFIARQFADYKERQSNQNLITLADNLSAQYDLELKTWNVNLVHAIGMNAMSNGYIISLKDRSDQIIWDANACDLMACHQIMEEITAQMQKRNPGGKGGFIEKELPLIKDGQTIGQVNIKHYSPYYLNEDDFNFLGSLNVILGTTAVISLLLSVFIGFVIARRLSRPILQTVKTTRQIAEGDYSARIDKIAKTREVEDLIMSVNSLAKSLQGQEDLRKQLTTDVAHELRTPLTTLQTHIEAMVEGVWEPTPKRLQSCHDEIMRINNLIVDLESLAKVESDNFVLKRTKTNLSQLAQKAVNNAELAIRQKELQVTVSGSCSELMLDEDRISQVIVNLLSNAIKYSEIKGHIDITVWETKQSAFISVKDNGAGISIEEQPFVFERFYRADKSRNRLTGGSGVGLTIVKSIVLAHGGKVSLYSKWEEGSTFTVELPRN